MTEQTPTQLTLPGIPQPPELITRAEYARRCNVAERTVGKYVQRGIIPLHNNKINPIEAEREILKYTGSMIGDDVLQNQQVNNANNAPLANTFIEARTKEKNIKVELLELDLALKKGETVLTKDVEFAAFNAARELRDRMLNIPDRVAAIVAAESDEEKVYKIILEQIENELVSVIDDKFKPGTFDEVDGGDESDDNGE